MDLNPKARVPNYEEVIRDLLSSVNEPISTETLAAQILQKRPSDAKNPHRAALSKIREAEGRLIVYVDAEHVLPVHLAFQGARFRIRLSKENVDQAALSLTDCFFHYLPLDLWKKGVTLLDAQDIPISFTVINPPHTISFDPNENVEYQSPVIVLKEWFRSQKIYHKDHILVTIKDWESGVLQLERDRFGDQKAELLTERNRYVASELYQLLETAKWERLYLDTALPTIYARMPDKGGYPPDHWSVILDNDPRMIADRWSIQYSDSGFSPLQRIIAEVSGQSLVSKGDEYTRADAKKIFRFRAQLARNPSIWREVEIQGKQTLQDLDDVLRIAFQHDTSDHLSGFWKKVAREGRSRKRYREVDIGTVNPFEYGEGSDTKIAAFKLQVGDKIKYVYDFGDWIEHTLELQNIQDPEKGARYPREVARNEPKYEYCVDCQKKGKETVATWICYTCSSEEQREVVLCEECMEEHEDHYVDELLY